MPDPDRALRGGEGTDPAGLLDAFRLTRAYRESSAEERQRLERYIRELDLSPDPL